MLHEAPSPLNYTLTSPQRPLREALSGFQEEVLNSCPQSVEDVDRVAQQIDAADDVENVAEQSILVELEYLLQDVVRRAEYVEAADVVELDSRVLEVLETDSKCF